MEKENCVFSNLPIIRKNTPIKHLGLSRKRKSCGSDDNLITKIQACSKKFPDSHIQPLGEKALKMNDQDIHNVSHGNKQDTQDINHNVELEVVRKRINEKEEKLKAIKLLKHNITHLEELIELWKVGCKNAFLHLTQLVKENHPEKIDNKVIINELGILKTMTENFENDSDIFLSDSSQ